MFSLYLIEDFLGGYFEYFLFLKFLSVLVIQKITKNNCIFCVTEKKNSKKKNTSNTLRKIERPFFFHRLGHFFSIKKLKKKPQNNNIFQKSEINSKILMVGSRKKAFQNLPLFFLVSLACITNFLETFFFSIWDKLKFLHAPGIVLTLLIQCVFECAQI